ncbi:MAG: polysaccharide biosynthesis/export family protein [Pseudomonadota bacterium]
MRHARTALLTLGLLAVLVACGRLPSGAPERNEFLRETTTETGDFAVYPVTRAFLPAVSAWPATGDQEHLNWIGRTKGAMTQIIQPGDMLNLQIWDSSENSLLTSTEDRVVGLESVEVAPNGTIFVPYVGDVNVIGLTPDLARTELQTELEAIVPSAQLQLSMSEGRMNSVDLVGGVRTPGTYPMPDRNFTVRSLLAVGGGVDPGLNNPQIRLVRGASIYGTSVSDLFDQPQFDTRLLGGDQVFVEEDSRYFLSFGATGIEDLHTFPKDDISAMDALSIVGGVTDSKADPQGLLILREYSAAAVAPGERGPRQTRVVFTVDLTSADGLFSARNFKINPQDVVMATESPLNDVNTIFNLVGNAFGVFSAAGGI